MLCVRTHECAPRACVKAEDYFQKLLSHLTLTGTLMQITRLAQLQFHVLNRLASPHVCSLDLESQRKGK